MQSPPNQSDEPTVRKPYVKPVVEHVQLKIEEAVLSFGCKNEDSTNGRGSPQLCGDVFQTVCDSYGS